MGQWAKIVTPTAYKQRQQQKKKKKK